MVSVKNYTEPPICEKEILRYAGCKSADDELLQLLRVCLEEVRPRLTYKVCYIELPLTITGDSSDFGCMKVKSKDLAKNLNGCENVVLFGATVGVEVDRLIAKYSHISPAKAVMLQAIGAERIEALCDAFCRDMELRFGENRENILKLRPRFSPGYGDLALEIQREIFRVLNCSKTIGISLNDSLLMTPSKSVTAFVGVGRDLEGKEIRKCAVCNKTNCEYRGM